ncbi:ABC transporter permease [Weissella soli]|uniref:ABC transporter permease n=1 Tax=Weissella soli TaxID=155866 RepID=UPI0011BAF186|nr:ABC transporter permease [Weissella soli]QEA34717.1 ABC transporter permease [Weissella soli]
MFLAIKEMLHEKLRYGLIIALILLVSYLLIILSGLATGLANLNRAAVDEWQASAIVLNKDAEGRLSQSFLAKKTVAALPSNGAKLSQYSTLVKSAAGLKENTQLIAVASDSFIYKNLKVTAGKKATKLNEGLVSDKFKNDGFKIGDQLKVANSDVKIKITGFTPRATLNVSPVVYVSPKTIQPLNKGMVNAVVFENNSPSRGDLPMGTKLFDIQAFINKLPGYSAQQLTFNFMIGFLYVIILIVISIFLYILTVQKLPNLGVLKAQGVSTKYLVLSILYQSLIMSIIGVVLAIILGEITAIGLPSEVPIVITTSNLLISGFGLIIMSLFGALIPIRQITKVDPYKIIGG